MHLYTIHPSVVRVQNALVQHIHQHPDLVGVSRWFKSL